MNCRKSIYFMIFTCFGIMTAGYGQVFDTLQVHQTLSSQTGLPFIQNYTAKDYSAFPQNWCVIQDKQGVMYFGNGVGILEYDGVSWRLIPVRNRNSVFSLAIDRKSGRIYVGAGSDFGYLAADSVGQLQYVSLSKQLPEKDRKFREIWHAFVTAYGVFFVSREGVFQWKNNKLKVLNPPKPIHIAHFVNNEIYARLGGIGLTRFDGNKFSLVPGGEKFANHSIFGILPFSETEMLISSEKDGFFLYDGMQMRPFFVETAALNYLKEHRQYRDGTALADGRFAFGTRSGGIAIIDRQGKLIKPISRAEGLPGNTVWLTYQDREGALWLALDNGLSRVEISSRLSFYDERFGFKGRVHAAVRHQGQLYIGTRLGTYYYDEKRNLFKQVEGIDQLCSQFLVFKDPETHGERLLVAGSDGVHEIFGIRARYVRPSVQRDFYTKVLHQSQADPRRLFVGTTRGLAVLSLKNGEWIDEGKQANMQGSIRSILEIEEGVLWVGKFTGATQAAYHFDAIPGNGPGKLFNLKKFPIKGKPETKGLLKAISGKPYLATMDGLFRFSAEAEAFLQDTTFETVSIKMAKIFEDYVLKEDEHNRIWINLGGESAVILRKKNNSSITFQTKKAPFLRFGDVSVGMIYPEKNDITWFGGADGLIRYDASVAKDYAQDFTTVIRRVLTLDDSVLYGGGQPGKAATMTLAYSQNIIHFEYAALNFEAPKKNRYQYFLQGFDKNWSDWRREGQKGYTNLPEGNYVFRVRSKNVYNHPGSEASYRFRILPPWYRTWWAYAFYGIFLVSMMIGIVRYRERATRRHTELLEASVTERTREVRRQKDQLAAQAKKLQEMDTLKTRFFSNISHEFRTPLTLIMGPVEQLFKHFQDKVAHEKLEMIRRNTQRLHRLINQLLDISRLEAGRLDLKVAPGNIAEYIGQLTMGFASWADRKNITLSVALAEKNIQAYFDRDVVDKTINNLLSNAMKFTPSGGKVVVGVVLERERREAKNEERRGGNTMNRGPSIVDRKGTKTIEQRGNSSDSTPGLIKISVKDNGIGIPPDRLPHIFDRFYQVDGTSTRAYEGSGIGLALTRELIERHYGEISVKSVPGKGTIFTVYLPAEKAPFAPEEVFESITIGRRLNLPQPEIHQNGRGRRSLLPNINRKPSAANRQSPTVNILIAEDHADFRIYIEDCLKAAETDYETFFAKNGKQGLSQALKIVPDLIISDVMMPEMNGYQLCEALKTDERTDHIPVILLTAKAGQEDKLYGLKIGADDYLSKPFDPRELIVRVENLVSQRRKLQARYQEQIKLSPAGIKIASVDQVFLQKTIEIIETHIEDKDFSVEALCRKVGMSRTQLHRKTSALTGESVTHLIRSIRLKRAAGLIKQKAGNITEIAFMTGFSSQSYFSKCFQEYFGVTPKQFEKQLKLE